MSEFPPSPVPSDEHLWPGELPFTAFGQWGEDQLDLRVFDQDVYWVDRLGRPHLLEEMSEEYRRNVVAWLLRYVECYHLSMCLKQLIEVAGEVLYGLPGAETLAVSAGGPWLRDIEPIAWLEATVLMRKLRLLTPET